MRKNSYLVVQITDMHLFSNPGQTLLGVNTDASFNAVVELIEKQHGNPDIIVLTGDLSQDETIPAYERLADRLSGFHCPKYWIPGNHDDTDYITKVFSRHHIQPQKHVIIDDWQLILLDSKKLNAVEGHMTEDQFILLEDALGSYPEHHALVFMHHHPMEVGSRWLDNLMLTNAADFWDAVEPYRNIKAVVCGHVHQEFEGKHGDVLFYSSPSTCFQFKCNSDPFAVEPLMPGYRVIEIYDDGSFNTEVFRVEDFELNLDSGTLGY